MEVDYAEKENYISQNNDPLRWRNHANYYILYHFKDYIKGDIADIGSNHCAMSILLNDFNPNSITCFDLNINALQVGAFNAGNMGLAHKMRFICTNIINIVVENENVEEKYDFVMSFHTLEHIYENDAPKVAKEIYKITKKGGYVLISIPYDHAYPDPTHVAFYKEDSLKALMESAGFITLECFHDNRFIEKDLLTALFYKPHFRNQQ